MLTFFILVVKVGQVQIGLCEYENVGWRRLRERYCTFKTARYKFCLITGHKIQIDLFYLANNH